MWRVCCQHLYNGWNLGNFGVLYASPLRAYAILPLRICCALLRCVKSKLKKNALLRRGGSNPVQMIGQIVEEILHGEEIFGSNNVSNGNNTH